MKIYLASFLQPQFHGPGNKIAISDSKPDNFKINGAFVPFIPLRSVIDHYNNIKNENQEEAAKFFVSCFKQQLSEFLFELKEEAQKLNKEPKDILPFSDGDTLLSWERFERQSYRPIVAEFLESIGYNVELK